MRLTNCDLAGTVLEELALNRVAFVGCRLSGADLGEANLADVRFTDCQLDELGLRMARTERLLVTGGTAQQIDLYRGWFNGSRWHDVDLTGAQLSGAHLERARFHGSTLFDVRGAKALEGAVIDREQVASVGSPSSPMSASRSTTSADQARAVPARSRLSASQTDRMLLAAI